MKTLYLIRHAKSSWKHDYLADFDRPLNKRGKRDAPVMGRRLKQHGVPGLFLSSPARRASPDGAQPARSYPRRRNAICQSLGRRMLLCSALAPRTAQRP